LQGDPQSDPLSKPEKAGVPKALSDVLMKGLSVHPNDRYQTALEMAAALAQPPPPPPPLSPWILIPAGRYRMGSDLPELNEDQPSHPIELAAFQIGRYLVTQEEYQRFIDANPDQKAPSSSDPRAAAYCWRERRLPPGTERLPVVLVSWQEAVNYCQWLSEQTGKLCRLPTEAEWEVAAGWDPVTQTARAYPWGAAFDALLCNAGRGQPSPVGHFSPQGDSAWDLADAVGNVWQWTTTGLWRYPYLPDGREDTTTKEEHRIVRGGAFDAAEPARDTLCARRIGKYRWGHFYNVGFRVVIDAAAPYDFMATRPAAKTKG
jgi:formylglycine-generating enzyme required for sulfatase activity